MTAKELIDEVLRLEGCDWSDREVESIIEAAPKLARMLKKCMEQRDEIISELDCGLPPELDRIGTKAAIDTRNAELDRIAGEE